MEKILDKKILKITFGKTSTKLPLSKIFLKTLGVTEEEPYVEIIYKTNEIIIKKSEEKN